MKDGLTKEINSYKIEETNKYDILILRKKVKAINYKAINDNYEFARGMRNTDSSPLTEKEIEYVKQEINRIEADESVFVFNDKVHHNGTCYCPEDDKIYITRNVFPDLKYGSDHPRDMLTVAAVLAHEYYGHRPNREEYLKDIKTDKDTTPRWKHECRASVNAAKNTPHLDDKERAMLIMDAFTRAREAGQILEPDNYMKEVLYGYPKKERNIAKTECELRFTPITNENRHDEIRIHSETLPEL